MMVQLHEPNVHAARRTIGTLMAGYIKVYRDMANHPLWLEEQFTRGQAWMDLLFRAAFKDSFFYVRGNKVGVLRGQCAMSQSHMSLAV
jgi:hypothetical protein